MEDCIIFIFYYISIYEMENCYMIMVFHLHTLSERMKSFSFFSAVCLSSRQKFGDLTVRQIERLRCRHRIRVLQAHEDTTKENAVSKRRR